MTLAEQVKWCEFWRCPWVHAEPDWLAQWFEQGRGLRPKPGVEQWSEQEFEQRPEQRVEQRPEQKPWLSLVHTNGGAQWRKLSVKRHQDIAKALGVEDAIMPSFSLLQSQQFWLDSDVEQRLYACALAGEILSPGAARASLNEQESVWCHRISAALRLNLPLSRDDPQAIGLAALRAWEPTLWTRLYWLFPRIKVIQSETLTLPPCRKKSLETVWQAVMWKVEHGE